MSKTLSTEGLGKTIQERVYTHLRDRIVGGDFEFGERMGELRLKQELGIGPIPLREALGRLERDGLLEYRSYRGFRVRRFSLKDLAEIYELRMGMECLAIDLLAEKSNEALNEALLENLQACVTEVENTYRISDNELRNAADLKFHRTIIEAAGNELLNKTVEMSQLHLMLAGHITPTGEGDAKWDDVNCAQHREICEALQARDFRKARDLTAAHIRVAKEIVLKRLGKALTHSGKPLPATAETE